VPRPLRLATRSPNKLIKLCIGVAFVTPNRLPTGMPCRHPSTRNTIRARLSSAVSYIQDAADAWRTECMRKTGQVLHSTDWNNFRLIAAWRLLYSTSRHHLPTEHSCEML
jgi:hypothetical protein